MNRTIIVPRKILKRIIDFELLDIIQSSVFLACRIKKDDNKDLLFSKLSLNIQTGQIFVYDEDHKQTGVYTYSVSEESKITLTITTSVLDGVYNKTIHRSDNNDTINIIYRKGDYNGKESQG